MPRYLIIKLDGPMQAWGGHTYEDFRPSHLFPTRSGLLGLIGACLGLDRQDTAGQSRLADSLDFTVRADRVAKCAAHDFTPQKRPLKLPDFHTVMNARKVDGSKNEFPVVSRREYLFDAVFTVAVGVRPESEVTIEQLSNAVKRPMYTPSLGRRSCPLTRPLFESTLEATDGRDALSGVEGHGLIYSESAALANARPLDIRDVPLHSRHRQFGTRRIHVHADGGEG